MTLDLYQHYYLLINFKHEWYHNFDIRITTNDKDAETISNGDDIDKKLAETRKKYNDDDETYNIIVLLSSLLSFPSLLILIRNITTTTATTPNRFPHNRMASSAQDSLRKKEPDELDLPLGVRPKFHKA